MKVIDVNKERFSEVEIQGHMALFTELRVDKSTIPEGVNCYELRHGDDDSYPAALEENVWVNYFGAVLMTDKMELGEDGWIPLSYDDFGFTGEELSVLELEANYREEPEYLSYGEMMIHFMEENGIDFPMTEEEADLLLGYIDGHDYMMGGKSGKLFRGDLCYWERKTRWTEMDIEDVILNVLEWNYDLIDERDALDCEGLLRDKKILNALVDRTHYGKEFKEMIEWLENNSVEKPDSIDETISRMEEEIAAGKELLPEVSPALKKDKGRGR